MEYIELVNSVFAPSQLSQWLAAHTAPDIMSISLFLFGLLGGLLLLAFAVCALWPRSERPTWAWPSVAAALSLFVLLGYSVQTRSYMEVHHLAEMARDCGFERLEVEVPATMPQEREFVTVFCRGETSQVLGRKVTVAERPIQVWFSSVQRFDAIVDEHADVTLLDRNETRLPPISH